MAEVVYLVNGVERKRVATKVDTTVMQLARDNDVDGVLAVCGGCCNCATCHVYVSEESLRHFLEPLPDELELLEGVTSERRPNSRLSCQLRLTADTPDVTVEIPPTQT